MDDVLRLVSCTHSTTAYVSILASASTNLFFVCGFSPEIAKERCLSLHKGYILSETVATMFTMLMSFSHHRTIFAGEQNVLRFRVKKRPSDPPH